VTDKDIKKIKKDYISGLKYKEIEEKNNITNSQLIYLIQKNKWKRKSNRSEALKKNKNAKGNKGGPGAEKGNKRARTTGEYENIFSGVLSEEEKNIFDNYEIENKKQALLDELKILTIREMRMLKRIKEIQDKNKDMTINNISKTNYQNVSWNKDNAITTITHAENTTMAIQRIEEALTRIQESKRRCIESLSKIGLDKERLNIEKEKLEIEKKRLEIELQNMDGEEIEDTSETDADLYGG
jgi:uncharacterized protein YjcR